MEAEPIRHAIEEVEQQDSLTGGSFLAAMTGRDPVVMQAIDNVTAQSPSNDPGGHWQRERTQAIYEEIRRLDQARTNKSGTR